MNRPTNAVLDTVRQIERENGRDAAENALRDAATDYLDAEIRTDGGKPQADADARDLPTEFGLAGEDAGRPVDALEYLKPGDRILWADR
jgi:hypothetical protein